MRETKKNPTLRLNRESIRRLSRTNLAKVGGGCSGNAGCNSYLCSWYFPCTTIVFA